MAKVDLDTGKVQMLKDDNKPVPEGSGLQPVDKLPETVRAAAQREGWSVGCVIGDRVYGQVQKQAEPLRFDSVIVTSIQAIDLKSGKLLWRGGSKRNGTCRRRRRRAGNVNSLIPRS